jgi:methylmalonyl-CoA/ethylmalonyl-CoA epimerase
MIRRIDHISVAVRDLAKAKAFFEAVLGAREIYSAPMEGQGFRWTTLEWGDSCLLELIDPVGDDGFLQRFLEKSGEGMHHITVQVEDARDAQERLHAQGVPTFGYSEAIPGWKEFFIHPKAAFGTLIQCAEFDPLCWINPGYIPRAYRDFAPGGPVSVATPGPGGADAPVEISDGWNTVRVRRHDVPHLVRRLQEALGEGLSPSARSPAGDL